MGTSGRGISLSKGWEGRRKDQREAVSVWNSGEGTLAGAVCEWVERTKASSLAQEALHFSLAWRGKSPYLGGYLPSEAEPTEMPGKMGS